MIAGPVGSVPSFFFLASAIAARYERFAWSRRIHSTYSGLGGLPPVGFEGSTGLWFKGFDGSVAEVGDAAESLVGDCCI